MKTSDQGKAHIKRSEGFVAHVYNDNGADAIAYGHRLLPGESFPDGVAMEEASDLLDKDLAERFEPMVNQRIPNDCTQGQFDALVDFVYNIKNQPTSLEMLLSHGWDQVPIQLPRWCHANGEENAGLKARRLQEVEMWKA